MHTPFRTTKFDVVTHMGRRLVFMWSSMPTTKGAWCQRSPISGVPFYLCIHPLCRTELLYTKFHVTWYVGFFLGGQPPWTTQHLKGTGSQRSPILGVPFCYASQNYQIWPGNTHVGAEFQHSAIYWVSCIYAGTLERSRPNSARLTHTREFF